jgi:hypothetical protein
MTKNSTQPLSERQQLDVLEQAKLDVTVFWRKSVDGILCEWNQPAGSRRNLSLFLEFNFPFLNLAVQKILKQRDPHSPSASKWLKENSRYPIDAYLLAEHIGWIACGEKSNLPSLFPLTEMAEWFLLNDLIWFSSLLGAVAGAIEKQIKIDPNAKMPKQLQAWCLERDKLPAPPSQWLEGTIEGSAKLKEIKVENKNPSEKGNLIRIPPVAGQENERRRKIFKKWALCWQAELLGLEAEIKLRSVGGRG